MNDRRERHTGATQVIVNPMTHLGITDANQHSFPVHVSNRTELRMV